MGNQAALHKKKYLLFSMEFDYNAGFVKDIKSLRMGAVYNGVVEKNWTLPVSEVISNLKVFKDFCEKWKIDCDTSNLEDQIKEKEKIFSLENLEDTEFDVNTRLQLREYQRVGAKYLFETERSILGFGPRLGKEQPIDTKVLTPNGWVQIGDLVIGDQVIGSDGAPTKIIGIYPQGIKPAYRLMFNDFSSVEAGLEHLWKFKNVKEILTTKEIIDLLPVYNKKLYLPFISSPCEFQSNRELPIPPYTVGMLIAKGSRKAAFPILDTRKKDFSDIYRQLADDQILIRPKKLHNVMVTSLIPAKLKNIIKELELHIPSSEKFIPDIYLFSKIEDRISLLQGLMDGNGGVTGRKPHGTQLIYATASEKLANNIRELVECLGGNAIIYKKFNKNEGSCYYAIKIKLPQGIKPFRLERKAKIFDPAKQWRPYRTLSSIEYSRDVESVCIEVEAKDHLYVTEHCILTHNSLVGLAVGEYTEAYPLLIVCPAGIKINWRNEILKCLYADDSDISIIKGGKGDFPETKFTIINYDILSKRKEQILERKFKAIIFDEIHHLITNKSQMFAASKEIAKKPKYVFGLTGTPVQNKTLEMANILDVIGRIQDFGGRTGFYKKYCEYATNGFGWKVINIKNPEKAKRQLKLLNEEMRSKCYIRRTKEEVLNEIPLVDNIILTVELDNRLDYDNQIKLFNDTLKQVEKEDREFLESVSEKSKKAANFLNFQRKTSQDYLKRFQLQRSNLFALRQLCGINKVKSAVEWIKDFIQTGEKLVVFAHHIPVQQAIISEFPGVLKITGNMKFEDRDKNMQLFQNTDAQLIICSLMAASEGIKLSAADSILFTEFPWNPKKLEQAASRIEDMEKKSALTRYFLKAEQTVDEYILNMLLDKERYNDIVTDDDTSIMDAYIESIIKH